MNATSIGLRLAPGPAGVSIWSDALFAEGSSDRLREFIGLVFSIDDVMGVEVRRDQSFARVRYKHSRNPTTILRKLGQVFEAARDGSAQSTAADTARSLFLEGPRAVPIEIDRFGAALSSWRVRYAGGRRLRVSHPILLRRRDVAHQLERSLLSLLGVTRCRVNGLAGSVSIAFDPALLSSERLVRQLERVWPALFERLDGPPSRQRLAAATGLLGLAATGQFFLPAVRPIAVVGVAIYGSTNVTAAFRQLTRFRIGLPALYTFGLGLMLVSGMPFNATIFAVLMQMWPQLAHGTYTRGERALFAGHRRRATWARLCLETGGDIEVDVETLRDGEVVTLRSGDIVPIDGVVLEGLAAVEEEALSGVAGAVDKAPGDIIYATSYVRDGDLKVRIHRSTGRSLAQEIADTAPRLRLADLPSALEAERIADRNARPALALAAASLFVSRLARPSQAIIRPDYITAPRLAAQLAALHSLGDALRHGIVFRRPGALDRLAATDVFVFDESAALRRRGISIADIFSAEGVEEDEVVRLAAAAFPPSQNERVHALQDYCRRLSVVLPEIHARRRRAGHVAYADGAGRHIQIDSAAVATYLPIELRKAVRASTRAKDFDPAHWPTEHLLRPLIVRRDGDIIGALTFERAGRYELAIAIDGLRSVNKRARFIYVSSKPEREVEALARKLGIDVAIGGLDAIGKARIIQQQGPRTAWIGDGTARDAGPAIGAACVSLSVGGVHGIAQDAADVLLLQPSALGLLPVRRIAREHRAALDRDYRLLYAVNLSGVAGGIFSNFSGLQAGLISNVGTAAIYLRHRSRLARLVSHFARLRKFQATPGREEGSHLAGKLDAGAIESYVDAPRPVSPDDRVAGVKGI